MPLNLDLLPDKPSGGLNLDLLPDKPSPLQTIAQQTTSAVREFTPELLTGGLSFPITHPKEVMEAISYTERPPVAFLKGVEAMQQKKSFLGAVKKGFAEKPTQTPEQISWGIADKLYKKPSTNIAWEFIKQTPFTTLGVVTELSLDPKYLLLGKSINQTLKLPQVAKFMAKDIPAPKWFDDAIQNTIKGFYKPLGNVVEAVKTNRINAITNELYTKFEPRMGELKANYKASYGMEATEADIKGLIKAKLVKQGLYDEPLIKLQGKLIKSRKMKPVPPVVEKPSISKLPEPYITPPQPTISQPIPPAITPPVPPVAPITPPVGIVTPPKFVGKPTPQAIIEQAGAKFMNITDLKNSLYPNEPTVYFRDPSGSTKTLPLSQVTPENVKAKFTEVTGKVEIIAPKVISTKTVKEFLGQVKYSEGQGFTKVQKDVFVSKLLETRDELIKGETGVKVPPETKIPYLTDNEIKALKAIGNAYPNKSDKATLLKNKEKFLQLGLISIPSTEKGVIADTSIWKTTELGQTTEIVHTVENAIGEPGTVNIKIPGDGEFKIVKNLQAIHEILKRLGVKSTAEKVGEKEVTKVGLPKVKIPKVQYSISQENYENVMQGKSIGKVGLGEKVIPPKTATGVMEWEKTEPWKVNLGRNITGVFEKEIGPKLQVSTRMKKWLGAYYPMLGESGTIKVRSLADEMTLNHETGHFLDDVLKKYPIEKRGDIRKELIKVTKYRTPFEERYQPIISKETGQPIISKKTGKPLMKQDWYTAYRRSRTELFADFISVYTSDPTKAKELAPKFTKIIEGEIAKDNEFSYIIDKLREFESIFKPVKDFVAYVESVRKVPEFEPFIKEWEKQGNIFQQLWRREFADKVWNLFTSKMNEISKNPVLRETFEKKGLDDPVFEVLRQRNKFISGQILRLEEEIIRPIEKLSETDQQYVAENLQRFETLGEETPLGKLSDKSRVEMTFWGLEAKKLNLLNDGVFWTNVGQHFPFMYSEMEFNNNKANFGFFPSKQLRANLSGFKHRLTDKEMGIKVLEAQLGTWPSSKAKIAQYPDEQLIKLGQQAREELGLIKTAAYPLKKRLAQLIETVNTVKAMNTMSKLPGVIGDKGMPGFTQLPTGARYGKLGGQYVPENLVREITSWSAQISEIGKIYDSVISTVKAFKVPWDPNAIMRNAVTNMVTAWFGDIPVYNPKVTVGGLKSYVTKDDTYKLLRDNGLYRHTFAQEELQKLAFMVKKDPENAFQQLIKWAIETSKTPGELYGKIEDASKTIIAKYALDNGASPLQAVKLADKWLFDYSSVSTLTKMIRRFPLPFYTWSAKMFPRLLETGIRKPEKILTILAIIAGVNYLTRKKLDISKEEEEKLKPDYIRGRTVLLVGKDKYGRLNWVDLSFFMPWWGWMPIEKGKIGVPQAIAGGNPLMAFYEVGSSNWDPYYHREIAPEGMSESQKRAAQTSYIIKKLGPRILTQTPFKIFNSLRGVPKTYPPELSKVLAGDFIGLKFVSDISPYQGAIKYKIFKEYMANIRDVARQEKEGYITEEKAQELKNELQYEYKERIEQYQ